MDNKQTEKAKASELLKTDDLEFDTSALDQVEAMKASDADMPEPDTKDYEADSSTNNIVLKPTWQFYKLFTKCTDRLPYASILQNSKGDKIKLIDLIHFVEAKETGMTVSEMDVVISFLANCKMEYVKDLMEVIENQELQGKLWRFE